MQDEDTAVAAAAAAGLSQSSVPQHAQYRAHNLPVSLWVRRAHGTRLGARVGVPDREVTSGSQASGAQAPVVVVVVVVALLAVGRVVPQVRVCICAPVSVCTQWTVA
jgi:hypothetical protein